MSTPPNTSVDPGESLGDNKEKPSAPAPSLHQTEQSIEDTAGEEGTTTQILPTRYVKSVDILVDIVQAMVGEQGDFQIEVRPLFIQSLLTTLTFQAREPQLLHYVQHGLTGEARR
jgi:hypothetical protein